MKTVIHKLFFPFSNEKRAYKILITMVGIVPILYFVYFSLTMAREGLMFSEFLNQNPWNSILFIVVLLNLAWAFILMKIYPDFENSNGNEYIGFILWTFFISQIAVTNLVFAIIAGIVLFKTKIRFKEVMKGNIMMRYKMLTVMAASLLLFSLLCGFTFIQISF